jgi:hypothetical protein
VRLLRSAAAEGVVAVTGGLGHDIGLVACLEDLLAKESTKVKKPLPKLTVVAHPLSMMAGALSGLFGASRSWAATLGYSLTMRVDYAPSP